MLKSIQLRENEQTLLKLKPQASTPIYLLVSNIARPFLILLIPFVFLFFSYQLQPDNQASAAFFINLKLFMVEHTWLVVVMIFILIFFGYFWAKWAVSQYEYTITTERVINYSGFWGVNCKIIPYSRMVDIDLKQNPIQQVLGIASVLIGEQNIFANSGNSGRRQRNANVLVGLSQEDANKAFHLISSQMNNMHQ